MGGFLISLVENIYNTQHILTGWKHCTDKYSTDGLNSWKCQKMYRLILLLLDPFDSIRNSVPGPKGGKQKKSMAPGKTHHEVHFDSCSLDRDAFGIGKKETRRVILCLPSLSLITPISFAVRNGARKGTIGL